MSPPVSPTADDIAFALVLACEMLGEKPELLFVGAPPSLAARHALAALGAVFPDCELPGLRAALSIAAPPRAAADAAFMGQDGFIGDVHRELTHFIRVRRRLWGRAP